MRELLSQYGTLNASVRHLLDDPKSAILEIDRKIVDKQRALGEFETANFGVPLGGSLIPWIDKDLGGGVSREEWKAGAALEAAKAKVKQFLASHTPTA